MVCLREQVLLVYISLTWLTCQMVRLSLKKCVNLFACLHSKLTNVITTSIPYWYVYHEPYDGFAYLLS